MDEDRFRAALREFESGQTTQHMSVESLVTSGRRAVRKRRRQRLTAVAAACVALAVGGPVARLLADSGDDRDPDVAITTPYYSEGAFSVDDVAYVGGKRVEVPGSVQSMRYSTAGVVVMWGDSPWTDNASTENYTLVTPEGESKRIPVTTEDEVVGVDAASPYFTYLRPVDGFRDRWDVVVLDLRSLDEVARVEVRGTKVADGFTVPFVALGGDVVWVQLDDGVSEVDWRTGDTRRVWGTLTSSEVRGGRYGEARRNGSYEVRDLRTGAVVSVVNSSYLNFGSSGVYGSLSPHGQFVFFRAPEAFPGEPRRRSVIAGMGGDRPVVLRGRVVDAGWTPKDELQVLRPDGTVQICAAQTAVCTDTGVRFDLKGKSITKMGGRDYQA